MAILTRARLAAAMTLVAVAGAAAQPAPTESDVKAAFLFNFAKYVEWPASAFPKGDFRICVVADRRFLESVDDIIAGESIEGRPVSRQSPATADAVRTCHILFVARGELGRADALLAAAKGAPTLTVGDGADFLKRGMVAFVREGDRVRFDVNVTEAQRAGLTISSRLLRVARRVSPAGTEP